MAAKRWLGVVTAVKQITTLTVGGTITIGDVFTILCGFGTVRVVAATSVAASVAAQVQAALAATSVSPEFTEAVWTVAGAVVTGTGSVAGVPFVVTSSATGTSTIVSATTTAATGPNFGDVAGNYNGGTLPVAADTLTVEANSPPILYGLTALTALLAKVTFEATSSATVGLTEFNPRGFREYRPQYWALNMTSLEVGTGAGQGSSQIKMDLGAVATAVMVFGTGFSNEEFPLQLVGGASATIVVAAGSVGLSTRATEIANFASVVVGPGASVTAGLTCTHTLVRTEGTVTLENTATTLDVRNGSCKTTGQAVTLDVSGGALAYKSASTITTATVGPGMLDCSDLRARTCTTLTIRAGGSVYDPQKTLTIGSLLLAAGVKGIAAS